MKNEINKENNLFKFAAKELSQDAFISWCINFYNYKKTEPKLYQLSIDILNSIIDKDIVNSIKSIEIKRQFLSIDILLILTLNNAEKHYVIIEDKIDSDINNNQKYFYINKLNPNKTSKNKLNEIGITSFMPQRISIVLLKTGFENNKTIKNPITYKNNKFYYKKITSLELYEILKKYKDKEIINQYYKYLEFNLKINNQLKGKDTHSIRKREYITIDETIFSKNYYCFNCFIHLIEKNKEEYTYERHPSAGGVILKELTNELAKELKNASKEAPYKICVDTIRFNKCKKIKNTFNEDKTIWKEIYPEDKEIKPTKIKYIFLFGKNKDSFEKTNYVFYGLYRFKETKKENNTIKNIWKKCETNNKNITLNKKELIDLIRKLELSEN